MKKSLHFSFKFMIESYILWFPCPLKSIFQICLLSWLCHKHFPASPHWWPLAHSWKDRNHGHVGSNGETQTFECMNWIILLSFSHLSSVMSYTTHIHDNSVSGVIAVFGTPHPGNHVWFSRLACSLLLLAYHRIRDSENGSCWKGTRVGGLIQSRCSSKVSLDTLHTVVSRQFLSVFRRYLQEIPCMCLIFLTSHSRIL